METNMVKRILEENYSLSEITSIEKSDAKTTHEPYVVIAGSKTFFLKSIKMIDNMNKGKVDIQNSIARHLHQKGVSTILPLANKFGETVTEKENVLYVLYPFLNIDKLHETTDAHFTKAIEILAKFHKAMEDFPTEGVDFHNHPMHTSIIDITFFTERKESVKRDGVAHRAKKQNTSFAGKVLQDSDFIKSAIIKVLNNLSKLPLDKQTVLHFDFNKENLFFSNGEFLAVSDFEYSHKGAIETDIAKAGKYWAENRKNAEVDLSKFKRFVREYSKHNSCSLDWSLYHTLLLYIALRRLVYAADWTLEGIQNLEFLYDYDIKMIRFLMNQEEEFKKE